jgi:hypothetical protein
MILKDLQAFIQNNSFPKIPMQRNGKLKMSVFPNFISSIGYNFTGWWGHQPGWLAVGGVFTAHK